MVINGILSLFLGLELCLVIMKASLPTQFLAVELIIILSFSIQINASFVFSQADLDKPYKFNFPRGQSERDLEICQDRYSPCNIIQNPYFFPFIVKRLCRCKNKECPDSFELKRSLDTVFINNREQIKFCDELPRCNKGGILRVGISDDLPYHLNCFCPPKKRYWKLLEHPISGALDVNSKDILSGHINDHHLDHEDHDKTETGSPSGQQNEVNSRNFPSASVPTKFFRCEKMESCGRNACGTIRSDLFATYQNCTCPSNSLCIPNHRSPTVMLEEVLYSERLGRISTCVSHKKVG